MHIQHARSSVCYIGTLAVTRRSRARIRRSRRQSSPLVARKTQLHARNRQSPTYAGRRRVCCRLESRWTLGRQRRRRWRREGFCPIIFFIGLSLSGQHGQQVTREEAQRKKESKIGHCGHGMNVHLFFSLILLPPLCFGNFFFSFFSSVDYWEWEWELKVVAFEESGWID